MNTSNETRTADLVIEKNQEGLASSPSVTEPTEDAQTSLDQDDENPSSSLPAKKPRRKSRKHAVNTQQQDPASDSEIEIIILDDPSPVSDSPSNDQVQPLGKASGEKRRTKKQRDRPAKAKTNATNDAEDLARPKKSSKKKKTKSSERPRLPDGYKSPPEPGDTTSDDQVIMPYQQTTTNLRRQTFPTRDDSFSSYSQSFSRRDDGRFMSSSRLEERRSTGNSLRMNVSVNVDMQFNGFVTGRNLSVAAVSHLSRLVSDRKSCLPPSRDSICLRGPGAFWEAVSEDDACRLIENVYYLGAINLPVYGVFC